MNSPSLSESSKNGPDRRGALIAGFDFSVGKGLSTGGLHGSVGIEGVVRLVSKSSIFELFESLRFLTDLSVSL